MTKFVLSFDRGSWSNRFIYLDSLIDKGTAWHTKVQKDNKALTIRAEVSPFFLEYPLMPFHLWFQEVHYYCRQVSCFYTTINTLPLRWWTVRFPNLLQSRQILRTHWSKSVNVAMTAQHQGNVKGNESDWPGKSDWLHSPGRWTSPAWCVSSFTLIAGSSTIKCHPFLQRRMDNEFLSNMSEVISNTVWSLEPGKWSYLDWYWVVSQNKLDWRNDSLEPPWYQDNVMRFKKLIRSDFFGQRFFFMLYKTIPQSGWTWG